VTTEQFEVVVVGGGAMGSAAAWQLSRRGVSVVLLERFSAGHHNGASHGASRMFRANFPDPVYLPLAREALVQWRELEQLTGTNLLTITGGVDHGRDPRLGELAEGLAAAGVLHQWMTPAEATERWPGIGFDTRVLYHPESGRIHADDTVTALQESAQKHGAVIRHEVPVTSIEVRGDESVEIRVGDDKYVAKRVIVAVSAWAQKLVGNLAPLPPLRVTQEQPAHFAPVVGEDRWPSFGQLFPRGAEEHRLFHGGIYGLATPGEGIKVGFHGVGPVVDPDERDFAAVPALMDDLREYVRRYVPGADPDSYVPVSCTYTTTEDDHFVLDRQGPVVVATGFSGMGFKFVPAIGRILADLATTSDLPAPVFRFRR
jgi:sarcosine oxidase